MPLRMTNPDRGHFVALARSHGEDGLICIAPRLTMALLDRGPPATWHSEVFVPAELAGPWVDVLTETPREQASLDVSTCLDDFPVAILVCPKMLTRPASR